jgi:hypothetical protein
MDGVLWWVLVHFGCSQVLTLLTVMVHPPAHPPPPPGAPSPLKRPKTHSDDFFHVLEVHEVTQLLFLRTLGAILEWVLCLLK